MAIVTHEGVIRYLLSKLGPEKRYFWDWKVPHGNGFELLWSSKEAFRRGERCNLLQAAPLTENSGWVKAYNEISQKNSWFSAYRDDRNYRRI